MATNKRKNTVYTIAEIVKWASVNNIKLLSTSYTNCKQKLTWRCRAGHCWEAPFDRLRNSAHRCPRCSKNAKHTMQYCQEIAIKKEGKCLSIEYVNTKNQMLWECKNEHQWSACFGHIVSGTWCPVCYGNIKPELEVCKHHATNLGGKLLSTEYVNHTTKLLWECKKGHQWKSSWTCVHNQNSWCPECSSGQSEKLCKKLLEQKLNMPFEKIRFYYDPTNKHKCYEFDGYNEEHKIAFEYNGRQHYEYPNHCHKTEQLFKEQQQRDLDKIQYAKDNGIQLIIIPCSQEYYLEQYINKQLENITMEQ